MGVRREPSPGAASAFLAPRLFAGATHFTARLGLGGAHALGSHEGDHGVVYGLIAFLGIHQIKAHGHLARVAA